MQRLGDHDPGDGGGELRVLPGRRGDLVEHVAVGVVASGGLDALAHGEAAAHGDGEGVAGGGVVLARLSHPRYRVHRHAIVPAHVGRVALLHRTGHPVPARLAGGHPPSPVGAVPAQLAAQDRVTLGAIWRVGDGLRVHHPLWPAVVATAVGRLGDAVRVPEARLLHGLRPPLLLARHACRAGESAARPRRHVHRLRAERMDAARLALVHRWREAGVGVGVIGVALRLGELDTRALRAGKGPL
mmetsp:Transcript_3277/g.8170  ORF Transcript_3277/g.8170 Transcript_3277/m.8170 type:complete len:243 (+) Transcript_3277:480-1208(+)